MSDVQLYLLEFESNKQEAATIAKKTAAELESRDIKLVEFIESLDNYVNNEDGVLRAKTIAYLADVLIALSPRFLTRQQRDLLNDFILSRIINGAEGLGHCAKGLMALEKMGNWDQERVVNTVNTLLDCTGPLAQSRPQSERFAVLSLIDVLLANYRDALRNFHEITSDFMQRFVAYFDGEKDPRNLMIVFSILQVPMVEWDVSADAQDLFESVFNYFPITFRPPPGDPYGITAQQLKDRLRGCIASTSVFAPYSFPALLDKLDSTSKNVKRDALQAITSCISNYGPMTINLYSITLWDALKFEILNVQEDDLAAEALNALQEIAGTLSQNHHDGPLQSYLKPVVKECDEHLEDVPTKQSAAAGRILNNVAKASPDALGFVVSGVLPQLLTFYRNADSIPRRRGLLEVLLQILQAALAIHGPWRTMDNQKNDAPSGTSPAKRPALGIALMENSHQCLEVLTGAFTATPVLEVSFRLLALEGIRTIVTIRQLLDETSIAKVVRLLNDTIILESSYGKDEVKAAAIDGLVEFAHQKPQVVIENAIPAFMGHLPDTDVETRGNMPALEALAKLSKEKQVFGTVVLRLKNKLYAAVRQRASPQYVHSVLMAMLYCFTCGGLDQSDPTNFAPYYADIVVPLLSDFCSPGEANANIAVNHNASVLDAVGRICNAIIRTQPFPAQTEISRNIYSFYQTTDLGILPPFDNGGQHNDLTMLVSTHLLAGLQREAIPYPQIDRLFYATVNNSRRVDIPSNISDSSLQQISLISNKFLKPTDTSKIIPPMLSLSDTDSKSLLSPSSIHNRSILAALAILKGLTLRIDPLLPNILPTFLSLLSNSQCGSAIAHGLGNLLSPTDLLTRQNHCLIYALHKQRVFSIAVPFLCKTFRTLTDLQTKSNYLVALSGILHHMPYALVQTELPAIVPLMLQSLALEYGSGASELLASIPAPKATATGDLTAASIALFSTIMHHDPDAVSEHTSSLITRLLTLATTKDTLARSGATASDATAQLNQPKHTKQQQQTRPPPKTRAAALACLASLIGSIEERKLLPYKRQVVMRLGGALDDGRRAVRAEAVRCRVRWEGLGDADEEA